MASGLLTDEKPMRGDEPPKPHLNGCERERERGEGLDLELGYLDDIVGQRLKP